MHNSIPLGRAAAVAGLAAAALALGTQAADASSIYACVNKRSGSARFVSAKTKCKKSERRVSWNAAGLAGAPGARGSNGSPGAAGAPGANGVGLDFASSNLGPVTLAEPPATDIVASKTIPAGSYLVSAKTVLGATKGKAAVLVGALCELIDSPGTPGLVEPPAALDVAEWLTQLVKVSGTEFEAATTLQAQAQLTTTQPTTLAMLCAPIAGGEEATFVAIASQLNALQTSANV